MTLEKVYIIKLLAINKDQAFQIIGPEGEIFVFDYIGKKQFSLYLDEVKIIEAITYLDHWAYCFRYNNKNRNNDVRLYPKSISGKNYKVSREQSSESDYINWTWKNTLGTSDYTLVDKSTKKTQIARISGFSLDGQDSGILSISSNIPKDNEIIILMTACMIWNRNLLSPWNNFVNSLNVKN